MCILFSPLGWSYLKLAQYYLELHRYDFSFYGMGCFEINSHVLIQFLQTKARLT